jgi:hypothetical protein
MSHCTYVPPSCTYVRCDVAVCGGPSTSVAWGLNNCFVNRFVNDSREHETKKFGLGKPVVIWY